MQTDIKENADGFLRRHVSMVSHGLWHKVDDDWLILTTSDIKINDWVLVPRMSSETFSVVRVKSLSGEVYSCTSGIFKGQDVVIAKPGEQIEEVLEWLDGKKKVRQIMLDRFKAELGPMPPPEPLSHGQKLAWKIILWVLAVVFGFPAGIILLSFLFGR